MSGQLPRHLGNTGTTVQVSAMSGHSWDILVTQAEPQNGFRVAPEVQQYTGITISGIRPFLDSPSLVPRPSIRAEGGSGEYSTKFLSTAEFRRYESDWSIRVTRYSHPQIPTQLRQVTSTSYLHVLS